MMNWKGIIELGHGVYLAIMLGSAFTGLFFGVVWIVLSVLMYIGIGVISAKLGFDQCTGDGRRSIDVLMALSRGLLIGTVVIWAVLAVFHSHGTNVTERLIRDGVEDILDRTQISSDLRALKKEIKNRPFENGVDAPYVIVPHAGKKESFALPVHKALQIISLSALSVIFIVTMIVFVVCAMFVLVCIIVRSVAPAVTPAAAAVPAGGEEKA
jgi:hypothetical protein